MRPKSALRAGQQAITTHVFEHDEGIIVARMGAGKTVSLLTAIEELAADGHISRAVVLAPPRVAATVWHKEVTKWQHLVDLPVFVGAVPPKARAEAIRGWARDGGVLTWSLANVEVMIGELDAAGVDLSEALLLIDEISALKAPTGKRSKLVEEKVAPRFKFRWGMTGTPRPNGWDDLFRPIRIVTNGRIWGGTSYDDWRRDHFRPDPGGYGWTVHSFAVPKFEQQTSEVMLQVPEEHAGEMPPMYSGPDYDIEIELPDRARAKYLDMEKKYLVSVLADLKGDPTEEVVIAAMSAGIASAKLSQMAQGFIYDEAGDAVSILHREKETALQEALLSAGHEPVVVCYGYRQDLPTIAAAAGVKTLPTLGGGTSAGRAAKIIDQFGRGEIMRMALHPASAGHGVDGLQNGGRRIIWFCPTWSNEQWDQTNKRLHRPGQTKPVYVHRIIAKDTVDEIKIARVLGKEAAQEAFRSMLRRVGE